MDPNRMTEKSREALQQAQTGITINRWTMSTCCWRF